MAKIYLTWEQLKTLRNNINGKFSFFDTYDNNIVVALVDVNNIYYAILTTDTDKSDFNTNFRTISQQEIIEGLY